MSGFEQLLWYLAVPATLVFAAQTILTLVGLTFDHTGVDEAQHHDGVAGEHAYFPVFTIRNLINFLMMFGWTGIAMIHQFQTGILVTALVSLVAGTALMFLVAFMLYGVSKLASGGAAAVDQSLVGMEAKVYLKIPARRSGLGKVILTVQGVQRELPAATEGPELPTGTLVKVTELAADGSVVVSR
ncbi:MAG: NfeD family protein [Candidatus Latescibacteria bacterium]|nr:NfeD family protein [Candidatus Latescibacterota bacterium]